MSISGEIERIWNCIAQWEPRERYAYVHRMVGMTIQARGKSAQIGQLCRLFGEDSRVEPVMAEVVGFDDRTMLLLPFSEVQGIRAGMRVQVARASFQVPVGPELKGRILDGLGRAIDAKAKPESEQRRSIYAAPPSPLERSRVSQPLDLGVRSIDGLLTCGRGQRLGIFAGSGVGKSTLLGMIARTSDADVNVIGLIGERGREVRDFIEDDLGPEGLGRSVVVVATSDQPALMRIKAAYVATTIAEYFREEGADVLLMMDSITRFAMAQREVGLAAGEPPTTRGYPPSVFSLLPQLLERSGNSKTGTMTAFYTVLVEGNDMEEPITDAVRGILDGHIQLSRELADEGHYPAVDVLKSVSRLMSDIVTDDHESSARELKRLLAAYQDARDLINIGAYQRGADPQVDRAIDRMAAIRQFLRQTPDQPTPLSETKLQLQAILKGGKADHDAESFSS